MTDHSSTAERIGSRAPSAALTSSAWMDAAALRPRKRVNRSSRGAPREPCEARNAQRDICFYGDALGRQHFNFPQRVWLYPCVPMAVTPLMSIELETPTINLLTFLSRQCDYRAAAGISFERVRRLASRFCAESLARSGAWVRQRSTPGQLLHPTHLSTRVMSGELRLGLLVSQISPLKREAMVPPHRPRLVNFPGAVDIEGGHGQALRRPRRLPPAAAVAKTRSSLPSAAADIEHVPPPLDQARARRDLRSLSSHAAACRK